METILLTLNEYWTLFIRIMPFLFQGFIETFKVSLVAILAGSTLGFAIGILRTERIPVLNPLLALYIHVLRGTPFLVQLYIFYYVMPNLNISWLQWDATTAAFVALSIYTSSYVSEIVSSAIQTVPEGQWNAATALGLTHTQTLRLIILPQAMRLMVPSMSGVYVMIIKSTAILSVVAITELTRQGQSMIQLNARYTLFIWLVVAGFYFIYCYPVLRFARWAEKKLGISKPIELN
ncbi:amino acid ABC transporter permease [Microvirga sp. W0021]|uniref:Amino acid ABC transporter permease n=1 Tax=Hohaiivirga grylli TaxID=3133970 RepID=A0ABV0BMF7_9HYPH